MRTSRDITRDATRLWRLCLVDGRADPQRVRTIVDRLTQTRRVGTPRVLSALMRLVRLDAARWSARVDSAGPLDPGEQAAIHDELVRRYGGAIETTFTVDPALIGGMRLAIGSDVYDGSIRGRLAALASRW